MQVRASHHTLEEINVSVSYTEEFVQPGLRLVHLFGALDTAGAMVIEDGFTKMLIDGDCSVIVDISEVDFVSSYGMRMLLIAAKRVHDSGCELHLAGPRPHIMNVLTIAGYHELFPIHQSADEARHFLTGEIPQ